MLERNRLLIDNHGNLCSPRVKLAPGHYLQTSGDQKAFAFAVRNLGFVGLQLGATHTRIWLTEAFAAPRAVLTARDMLRHHQPFRTVLTIVASDSEHNRLLAGWQSACTALLSAASNSQAGQPDAHLSQVRGTDAILKFPILEHAYRSWTTNSNPELIDQLLPVLERTPAVRFVLAECARDSGTSVIRQMGGAFTAFEHTWLRMAGGLRVQDQPDYAYGMWIAQTYAHVATSGTAAIDDVDIKVRRPRTGLIRSRYRRLILPIATRRSDRMGVLSINMLDRTIDLRSVKTG